eukprot:m.258502 g.258502  ORF g.258502 m.258502 type:complete len:78 (+) comp40413_c2_seq72:174-407(+)
MASTSPRVTYLFEVFRHDNKSCKRAFKFEKGKRHEDVLKDEKNKKIIQGIVTVLKQGGKTTVKITTTDDQQVLSQSH